MSEATYLILGMAALSMLLSYTTRVEARGAYPLVGHRPMWRELLDALNMPCMIGLLIYAFLVYPWQWVLGGVVFFLIVFAFVQGLVIALLGGPAFMEKLSLVRPVLDIALVAGTVTLWWRYYPL